MAEAKPTKKMTVTYAAETGTLTHSFGDAGSLAVSLNDYPQNVRDYFTLLGLKTAHRNATIGSEDEGSVGTPASMLARLKAKVEAWKQGTLRTMTGGEERSPATSIVLEAAVIYKRMKAAMAAGKGPGDYEAFDGAEDGKPAPTAESLRPEVEALDDVITNPADVEKAKAEATAKGEDAEAAGAKAAVTRLDQLKATTLFKLATEEAKRLRADAKRKALMAAAVAEAAPKA